MNRHHVHPVPSARARETVRKGYDLHVHSGPDAMPRSNDDIGVARRLLEVGMAGFAIKHHYSPTAGRAALTRSAVPGVDVVGGIVLNGSVGGANPLAVVMAAREGARIVWLPTVDAGNERAAQVDPAPGASVPVWARLRQELRAEGVPERVVDVVDTRGQVLPEVVDVMKVVARYDMILATAHLGRDEIFAVVEAALRHGVQRIVITHPEFPSQDLSVADQVELARAGAVLEHCLTTPYTGKCTWERVAEAISSVGARNCIISSDVGQVSAPPVEDGVAIFADMLFAHGVAEEDVRTMAVDNPRRLVRDAWSIAEGRGS